MADGGWVVVWVDNKAGNIDIRGQRYDFQGNAVGGQFNINTGFFIDEQFSPEITALPNGGFAVVWVDNDAGSFDIRGSIYDAAGDVVSADFDIAAENTATNSAPSITAFSDSSFVVSYTHRANGQTDS